ncbi:phenylalanine--tRNA ligase subunit beta [Salinisphaera aquimarina]|uniref:Phenylalanine--tRNA ligase beta subunit n=1 Tax=Salinisphaera aquimarina TaxID=2094031 RepID=A0ABV7ESE1_9GAMM
MKISEQWLRSWVATTASLDTLAEALTMAGLEVDAIEAAAPSLDGVVVGRIVDCMPHPEADRLQLCRVDVGADESLAIVCGAPNAATGAVVPVATVGTVLPGGMKIKPARIRGQASSGMLCSASELGFAAESDGLWLLDDDATVGATLAEHLGLPDAVLEIDLTPNRGDCLSLRGIAREVAVAEGISFSEPPVAGPEIQNDRVRAVRIEAPECCPGYAAQAVVGTRAAAKTPLWMRERLRRAGVRQISLPVDIGNYVMLELGQPMHAFDGDKLVGTIRVRMAEAGEQIVTLDGEQVTLATNTLVIADDDGPVAIAGMIGGQRTAVDETTTHVVFESACFAPSAVAGRGRQYKIHTDSLHRFERGVDPQLHPVALARASRLLVELGGGQAGPETRQAGDPIWCETRRIELRARNVERLLGQAIDDAWIVHALEALGVSVDVEGEGTWVAQPPSWRFDLNIEADLIEEIARVYGYDRLETHVSGVTLPPVRPDMIAADVEQVDAVLRERGYSEAITYSFVEPGLHALLTADAPAIKLDNPISDQYAEMRRTLWASLLPSWHHNVRRQHATVRLYERGLRFLPDAGADDGIRQVDTVAGLISGQADDTHWDRAASEVDFFDIKGDVEALLHGHNGAVRFEAESHPALHPGRCARVYVDGNPAGWLGQLAPAFSKRYKNIELPYLFELDYKFLTQGAVTRFEALSEQPLVRRDLAIVVAEKMPVAQLIDAIESLQSPDLRHVEVFDVFRGQGLDTGFKSVALGLIFQDKASTLTDDRVDTIIIRVVSVLSERCDARIRGE